MEPIFDFEGFVPAQVQQALESAYLSQRRVRIWYGFTESHLVTGVERHSVGLSWGDVYAATGRISRSTGQIKFPLLVNNKRSLGGGAIIVNSIIRIDDIASRTHLFKHPKFHSGFENSEPIRIYGEIDFSYAVFDVRAVLIARFKDLTSAQRFIDFQNGERYSK